VAGFDNPSGTIVEIDFPMLKFGPSRATDSSTVTLDDEPENRRVPNNIIHAAM
jgi:hypothetical protein